MADGLKILVNQRRLLIDMRQAADNGFPLCCEGLPRTVAGELADMGFAEKVPGKNFEFWTITAAGRDYLGRP